MPNTTPEQEPAPRPGRLKRVVLVVTGPWTWRNLASWVGLLVALLLIKACLLDQYTVPTGSMEPTIHGDPRFLRGDRLLVNKAAYGLRVPFTNRYLWRWDAPDRWEIVVFTNPTNDRENNTLVKRVAGLPGERIILRNGQVTVDGEAVPLPDHMPDSLYYVNRLELQRMTQSPTWEENPRQRAFLRQVLETHPIRYVCNVAPGVPPPDTLCVVPEGHYLVLGDNSVSAGQFSLDGRVWGWLPAENLLGRAIGIWWPLTRRRDFTGWTDTWYGLGLLYGVPAVFALYEILRARKKRQRDKKI